jgi:hypothetical protein
MMLELEAPPKVRVAVQAFTNSGSVRVIEPEQEAAEAVASYVREGAAEFRSWNRLPQDEDLTATDLFD